MLSGRLRAAFFNRTGRFVAAISLEEKFCAFAAAQAAHRISIPSQSFLPPVSNTDGKVYRPRIHVTRIPALLIARIADSRPPPGPFTRTSACCMPASVAFLAASYAACCAANGVPLRDPRNPRAPEDDCAIKFPSRSVIEIIVLLNDAA